MIKTEKEPLRVISLRTSNFMNIELIELTPKGNTIIISGPNGAGKSSLINSIIFALGGIGRKQIPRPLRDGAKSGEIVLDLGDIVVKKSFTNSKSGLVVENSRGMIYKGPQALLDGFRGKISFDPMEYAALPEKQQKEILLKLIDLPIDLDSLDNQRKEIYDNRTLVNRDIKQLTGQMEGIKDRLQIPDEELSAADVMDEMKTASEEIATNQRGRDLLRSYELERSESEIKLEQYEEKVTEYKKSLEQLIPEIEKLSSEVELMIDPDLEKFKCQMDDVELINQHVREKQERRKLFASIESEQYRSRGLTEKIEDIDALKSKTIQEANMPVPGLGFDENGVTFEDIPLAQRSDGERRKISARIGMALNPDLRVLWLKDASLLDHDSMKEMENLADEHGYQIWLERVGDEENVAIHIEEGRVVS